MTVRRAKFVGNPWSALDHEGRPSGHYPVAGAHNQYVGAQVDPEATKELHKADPGAGIEPDWDLVWKFTTEPVEVPLAGADAAHYMQGVRSGDIFPADAATARACGVKFVEPSKALAEAEKKAKARWEENYGEAADRRADAAEAAPAPTTKPEKKAKPAADGGPV